MNVLKVFFVFACGCWCLNTDQCSVVQQKVTNSLDLFEASFKQKAPQMWGFASFFPDYFWTIGLTDLQTEISSRIGRQTSGSSECRQRPLDEPDLRPNCPVCSGGRRVESRGQEMHWRVGNWEQGARRWQSCQSDSSPLLEMSAYLLQCNIFNPHTGAHSPHLSHRYLCWECMQVRGLRSHIVDYSFIGSLALSLFPASSGAHEEGMYPPLLQTPITAGHITALPFFRFIFQSLYDSSLCQRASVSICLPRREVNIPIDESLCASAPDVFRVTPSLKAFISSAVRPQNFHSIVTPNKHPNCKSCRPAQPSLLPWG